MELKCESCQVILVKAQKKFCSRECFYKNRIGQTHSSETKKAIALSNSKPFCESRKKNLSLAKQKKIPLHLKKSLSNYLQFSFLSHQLLRKHFKLTYNVYHRWVKEILEENPFLKEIENSRTSFTYKIWSIENLMWLSNNLKSHTVDEIKRELKLKIHKNNLVKLCLNWFGDVPKGYGEKGSYCNSDFFSQPERIFNEWLLSCGIEPFHNVYLKIDNKRFWVDFIINNKIYVEVHGDYWHGNPVKYKETELNEWQLERRKSDKIKRELILKTTPSIYYFEIWEKDIVEDSEKYQKIKNEILCILQKVK